MFFTMLGTGLVPENTKRRLIQLKIGLTSDPIAKRTITKNRFVSVRSMTPPAQSQTNTAIKINPSYSPSVIFHFKKRVLKKSEYWQRNEHISFLTGSKNTSFD